MRSIPVQYQLTCDLLATHETDCLVVGVCEDGLSNEARELDLHLNGLIQSLLDSGDITGEAGTLFSLYCPHTISAKRLLIVGFGKTAKLNQAIIKKGIIAATKWIKSAPVSQATFALLNHCSNKSVSIPAAIEAIGTALYRYDEFKSEKPSEPSLTQVFILEKESSKEIEEAIAYGTALVKGMNFAKDLGNAPGNRIYPETLSEAAENLASNYRPLMTCKILNDADIKRMGMNALMAVAKGSSQSPNLIVLNYHNAGSKDIKPVVLVGKGVTFDSGGISLKPAAAMDEMKYDMCGAASVLGCFQAMAELELPINAIGIIPAVENMPSGTAVKPGDIVTSMSGQTIEIINTDAEGRLILCDALTYAEQFDPEVVVDIATLTGAIIVALGHVATGLFSNNEELTARIQAAATTTHDQVWPMPAWDDYQPLLDSNFADMANTGGRDGGAISAACFLSRFATKFPWAHLDIAGTAWNSGKEKGATGRPVPLLLSFLKSYVVK